MGTSRYHETYAAWQRDPMAFWAEAAQAIDWIRPPEVMFDAGQGAGSATAAADELQFRRTRE